MPTLRPLDAESLSCQNTPSHFFMYEASFSSYSRKSDFDTTLYRRRSPSLGEDGLIPDQKPEEVRRPTAGPDLQRLCPACLNFEFPNPGFRNLDSPNPRSPKVPSTFLPVDLAGRGCLSCMFDSRKGHDFFNFLIRDGRSLTPPFQLSCLA